MLQKSCLNSLTVFELCSFHDVESRKDSRYKYDRSNECHDSQSYNERWPSGWWIDEIGSNPRRRLQGREFIEYSVHVKGQRLCLV